ncbi:Beta-fructosidase [Mycobacteroides abscessus subsp. abscessus]|nr:Beta-fructosidase [Mycobacteroides abscessus subsp. abscessus]
MTAQQASEPTSFFPHRHRVHTRGWINDPNGIHKNGDTWHVYFQWNPHSARHDRIHWGHMISRDLVHWEERPAALIPREGEADSAGCWSGVGLVDHGPGTREGGTPTLVYSGVEKENPQFASAIVARGNADESIFDRFTVAAPAPDIEGLTGIRDPFVLEAEGHRFVIQGAGIKREDGSHDAVLLAWLADDLENWMYLGEVASSADPGLRDMTRSTLWECPQLVCVDGHWVLIVGLWHGENEAEGKPVLQGSGYALGSLEVQFDGDTPCGLRFHDVTAHGLVDQGPDFYAPQAYVDGDRVLLWGWSWENASRTQEETDAQGWAGCLTLPRELHVDGDLLVSRFPEEVLAHAGAAGVREFGSDGCLLTVVDSSGVEREVARLEGAGVVAADASIIEVLPSHGTPTTLRVYGEIRVHS